MAPTGGDQEGGWVDPCALLSPSCGQRALESRPPRSGVECHTPPGDATQLAPHRPYGLRARSRRSSGGVPGTASHNPTTPPTTPLPPSSVGCLAPTRTPDPRRPRRQRPRSHRRPRSAWHRVAQPDHADSTDPAPAELRGVPGTASHNPTTPSSGVPGTNSHNPTTPPTTPLPPSSAACLAPPRTPDAAPTGVRGVPGTASHNPTTPPTTPLPPRSAEYLRQQFGYERRMLAIFFPRASSSTSLSR